MDTLSTIILIGEAVLGIVIFLLWSWLKKLPDRIHKRNEQTFQHELNTKLESFKSTLTQELEMMKIAQSQIQLRKIERFMDFAKIQTDILTNDNFKEKIQKNDPKAVAKLRETVVELGIGLYFFASDDTIRKYSHWRLETAKGNTNPFAVLSMLGELMVSLRKDVGYQNTELDGHDYLKMFITDWEETKDKIKA